MLETFHIERYIQYGMKFIENTRRFFMELHFQTLSYLDNGSIQYINTTEYPIWEFAKSIYCWMRGIPANPIMDVPVVPIDPVEKYIENARKKWEKLYAEDVNLCVVNQNICSLFYQKEEFLEFMKQENTEIEKEWKRRILMESTPRGNVIMYYDAYKLAFAYYSDQTITYNVLNAVAMKYVVLYGCRDFFWDNQYFETNSPLLEIYEKEKEEPKKKNTKEDETTKVDQKSKVFAKLKNYNTISSKTTSSTNQNHPLQNAFDNYKMKNISKENDNHVVDKVMWKNKFVSFGKIVNFQILQKIKKLSVKKEIPMGIDFQKHDAEVEAQGLIQKEFMNYRKFKEMQKAKRESENAENHP
jgi:hypothetical protein